MGNGLLLGMPEGAAHQEDEAAGLLEGVVLRDLAARAVAAHEDVLIPACAGQQQVSRR